MGKIELGLQGLNVGYEARLSNQLIWDNNVGMGGGYNINVGESVEFHYAIDRPVFFAQSGLKYYYNLAKRERKGKRMLQNAGNYISLRTKYSLGRDDNLRNNKALLSEIHWGIQRPLGKRFLFNFHLGLGYIIDLDNQNGLVLPTLGVKFGYRLW